MLQRFDLPEIFGGLLVPAIILGTPAEAGLNQKNSTSLELGTHTAFDFDPPECFGGLARRSAIARRRVPRIKCGVLAMTGCQIFQRSLVNREFYSATFSSTTVVIQTIHSFNELARQNLFIQRFNILYQPFHGIMIKHKFSSTLSHLLRGFPILIQKR